MIKKFFTNFKYFILLFILSLTFCITSLKYFLVIKNIYFVISGVLFFVIAYLMYIMFKKFSNKVEFLFLILAIPIGLMYTFYLSPLRIMDDSAHIAKNIDISQGNLFTAKNDDGEPIIYTPSVFDEFTYLKIHNFKSLNEHLNMKTDYSNLALLPSYIGYTALNMPTVYTISALGFGIGKVLNLNLYFSMYLAKVFNVIFFLIIGYLVIKLIPSMKFFTLVFMLNPMFLQCISSVGADCFTNLISLLFISYVLFLRNKENITNKNMYLLLIIMLLLSTAKFIYFPLLFLTIFIFKKLNKKQKRILYIAFLLSLILAGISIVVGLGYKNTYLTIIRTDKNVDTMLQVKLLLTKPWKFIIASLMSIYKNLEGYIAGFFGKSLGYYSIRVFYSAYLTYLLIFGFSLFYEKVIEFTKKEKLLILGITFILICCIFGVEYLTYTNVGANVIDGIQGRYFIPFMLLPLLLINTDKIKFNFKNYTFYTSIFIFILHLLNILVIIKTNF